VPRIGKPKELSGVHLVYSSMSPEWSAYDVAADVKRFLVDFPDHAPAEEPINMIVNWEAEQSTNGRIVPVGRLAARTESLGNIAFGASCLRLPSIDSRRPADSSLAEVFSSVDLYAFQHRANNSAP
jgi:hypothetical protein